MTAVEIVRAYPGHIDEIVVIENLSFKIPWTRQAIVDEITENKHAVYMCALLQGKVVGYAGMWHVADEGHITNIAVHPEFRCCGVGSALMGSLINYAETYAIVNMTLEVRKSNLAAQALYKKFAFQSGGLRKSYYADNNEDAIVMWRSF